MSIIAVRKHKDRIEIAADSQTTQGEYKYNGVTKEKMFTSQHKISEINEMVISSAGDVGESSLLKYFCTTTKPKNDTEESIFDFLIRFMEWKNKKINVFEIKNQYIIIYKNKIFQIEGMLVREVSHYCAIGSGMYVSLGVLYKDGTAKEAVEAAIEFDLYCSGKIQELTIKL